MEADTKQQLDRIERKLDIIIQRLGLDRSMSKKELEECNLSRPRWTLAEIERFADDTIRKWREQRICPKCGKEAYRKIKGCSECGYKKPKSIKGSKPK
jgi:ribosomal protein L32E